jgi:hypothetical protein
MSGLSEHPLTALALARSGMPSAFAERIANAFLQNFDFFLPFVFLGPSEGHSVRCEAGYRV